MTVKRRKKPTVAILYDFDNTLSTKDMQEYTFIPSVNMSAREFWAETNHVAKTSKMDEILAYMYVMLRKANAADKPITRKAFVGAGKKIKLFPGVKEWFGRINEYGKLHGVKVEHYIISSGLKEIIEGCEIKDEFKEIYASEFHYNVNGVADWPKLAINYTNKTQFLFRVNKGCLAINDDNELNKSLPAEERPVPFQNMIYIGDGMTDVPCMKIVKLNGGHSIAIYRTRKVQSVTQLIKDDRVNFVAKADYRSNSELDKLVKDIIDQIASVAKLIGR